MANHSFTVADYQEALGGTLIDQLSHLTDTLNNGVCADRSTLYLSVQDMDGTRPFHLWADKRLAQGWTGEPFKFALGEKKFCTYALEHGSITSNQVNSYPHIDGVPIYDASIAKTAGYSIDHMITTSATHDKQVYAVLQTINSNNGSFTHADITYLEAAASGLAKAMYSALNEGRKIPHDEIIRTAEEQRKIYSDITARQEAYLPNHLELPPGWEGAAKYQPSTHAGGDFYNSFKHPFSENWLMYLGDVSGHGIKVAEMTERFAKAMKKAGTLQFEDPIKHLEKIRRTGNNVGNALPSNIFCTGLVGMFTSPDELLLQNLGHQNPLIYDKKNHTYARSPESSGTFLGLVNSTQLDELDDNNPTSIHCPPGSCILMITDGAEEVTNPNGEMLRLKGVKEQWASAVETSSNIHDAIEQLYTGIMKHSNGRSLGIFDDLTLVGLHRRG